MLQAEQKKRCYQAVSRIPPVLQRKGSGAWNLLFALSDTIPTFPRVCFVQVAEAYGPWKETGETNSVGEVRKLKEEKTLQMPKQENEDTYVIHEGRDPPRQWYV